MRTGPELFPVGRAGLYAPRRSVVGAWAASPHSPQWSQTSLVQRAFVHEGSSGPGGGGGRCELFAATPPAVGGEHPVQDRL